MTEDTDKSPKGETPDVDAYSGVETTGHEWDGITELDNPLPRWWLWVFYASIFWAVIYMIFMPAIPALPGFNGHTPGLRGHSERANVAAAIEELERARAPMFDRLQQAADAGGARAIESNEELLIFALNAGESAFGDNCATCHGAGGGGYTGYPNLNDDDWIWPSSFDDIRYTIRHGIRWDNDPDTRFAQMPAYGRDGILSREEIADVADYVLTLSELTSQARNSAGAQIFATQCASCHGAEGLGNPELGAPNLADSIWLYGGSVDQVRNSIWRGPYGVMPAWSERLNEPTITALAAYVYLRGERAGGEDFAALDAEAETQGEEAGR